MANAYQGTTRASSVPEPSADDTRNRGSLDGGLQRGCYPHSGTCTYS